MVIKRKYELIGHLIHYDQASKEIFFDEMRKSDMSDKDIEDNLTQNAEGFLYLADMGSCIPHLAIIRDRLDKLDVEKPYDNGMTYSDVTNVATLPSRKGKATVLVMTSNKYGEPLRIVQVTAVEYEDGVTKVIEPWNIDGVIIS